MYAVVIDLPKAHGSPQRRRGRRVTVQRKSFTALWAIGTKWISELGGKIIGAAIKAEALMY